MPSPYPARIDFSQPQPPKIRDAIETQRRMAAQVSLKDDFGPIKTIAGIDVGYDLKRELTKAVVVVLDYETLELQTSVIAYAHTDFPYISGLLAFRESPTIIKALDGLRIKPDLLMVDGHGIAHPRRLGIAAHLGVITGLPAIGVAKSRLTGKHDELIARRGTRTALHDKNGETIGMVICSKDKCNPLYISAGHRISHETALDITLRCLKTYRLPEPTRIADQISKWRLDEKDPPPLAEDLFGKKDV